MDQKKTFTPSHLRGDIVYLRTDIYQLPRCVTNIRIDGDDTFSYLLTQSHDVPSWHYACEISTVKNNNIVLEYGNLSEG